jgi:hypothetical protein
VSAPTPRPSDARVATYDGIEIWRTDEGPFYFRFPDGSIATRRTRRELEHWIDEIRASHLPPEPSAYDRWFKGHPLVAQIVFWALVVWAVGWWLWWTE